MGLRFFRRVKLAPGLYLNLSKSGFSFSIGPRGAKYTIGPRGKRVTLGIPGTGLYYTKKLSGEKKDQQNGLLSNNPLSLGFFKKFFLSPAEKAMVAGCRALMEERDQEAYDHFMEAQELPDGAYMAGSQALKLEQYDKAVELLEKALSQHEELGSFFEKHDLNVSHTLPVTEEVEVVVPPGIEGVRLFLAETYQKLGRIDDAIDNMRKLLEIAPKDPVASLSLAELLVEYRGDSPEAMEEVIRLTQGISNDDHVHTALLLYRAKALRAKGMNEAARQTLTEALRKKKGRSQELLHAILYERAEIYLDLGEDIKARRDFERIYAEDPDYEDVADRLS